MNDRLMFFADLDEPATLGGIGWYVACVAYNLDEYYLHDDGRIYDTCAARYDDAGKMMTTGWFPTEIVAYMHAQTYYNRHGVTYPYIDQIPVATTNKAKSQVMEFE